MRSLGIFNRRHAVTIAMIIFAALFYSVLWIGHRTESKQDSVSTGTKITAHTMKENEAIFRASLEKRPRLFMGLSLGFLLALFLGLFSNLYLLIKKTEGVRWFDTTGVEGKVPWGMAEVVRVFVMIFFVEACILSIEIILHQFISLKAIPQDLLLMANSFTRDLVIAAFVLWVVSRRYHEPLASIGLTRRDFFGNIRRGAAGYVAMLPLLFLVLFITAMIAQSLSYEPPPQPIVEIYLKKSSERYLVFFTLFVAMVGPVIEEIFFRGFAYRVLRDRWGARAAMVGTAAVFSAMHMNWIAAFPIFFLGVFLAYLYEKTGSLVPSMTAHVLHNVIMVGLTLGFKSIIEGGGTVL